MESGETTSQGGYTNATAPAIALGDNAANKQYRSILNFYTGALPDNAVVTSVKLSLKRKSITGTNPFVGLGKIGIDIRKWSFSSNPALQPTDFQATASHKWVGNILNNPSNGWYSAKLFKWANHFVNLVGPTQLRLRFGIDDNNDWKANIIRFYSGNAATYSQKPKLTVKYYIP